MLAGLKRLHSDIVSTLYIPLARGDINLVLTVSNGWVT